MRTRPVVLPMIGLLAAGCGPASSAVPASTATATAPSPVRADPRTIGPPTPPRPPATLTRARLANGDDGATLLARPGQQITVTLTPDLGNWVPLHVSDPRVLRPVTMVGGYPSRNTLRVVLTAAARGQAQLTTHTDLACLHGRPACQPPMRSWRVRVTVH